MKNKSVIVSVVVALLVLGGGAFYFMSKDDTTSTNTTTTSNSESKTAETQETKQEEKPKATLSSAISAIGATGNAGPVNGTTYTFNGVAYKFEEPSDWNTSLSQRKQACDQGYINTSYQVATDGKSWFATTDSNADYLALVDALKGAGIEAKVDSYCQ